MKTQYTVDGYVYQCKTGDEYSCKTTGGNDKLTLSPSIIGSRYTYIDPTFETEKKDFLFRKGKDGVRIVSFVGLIFDKDNDILTVSVPKSFEDDLADDEKKEALTTLVVNLMELYSDSLIERDPLYKYSVERYNEIVILHRMMQHYLQYGHLLKVSRDDNREYGPINWDKTVTRCIPDHIQGVPVYSSAIHQKKIRFKDEIARVEESIMAGLLARYGFVIRSSVDLMEYIPLGDMYDSRYYIQLLEERRQLTYLDHELEQLDLMLDLVQRRNTRHMNSIYNGPEEKIQILAVSNFDVIFELLIGDYYGNQIDIRTKLPKNDRSNRVIDVVFKSNLGKRDHNLNGDDIRPYHYETKDSELADSAFKLEDIDKKEAERDSNDRINIPDVIFDTYTSDAPCCVIIDAKYYSEKNLPNNESVYKQVFYRDIMERVYRVYGEEQAVNIHNMFMLPLYDSSKREDGKVIWRQGMVSFTNSKFDPIYVMRVDTNQLCHEVMNRDTLEEETINTRRRELIKLIETFAE